MKKNSDIKKAVIYARFSSHSQNEQSIEGQLKDCYAFAEKEGIKVIGEYIDRAKSARTADRPDFQRMIKDASKRLFDYIIVWKLDRFTRNRYDSAIFKAKLKKYGVKVLSAMENISDSPEGIILEGLLEAMAEYYSANLSENIIRGQRETIEKGKFTGGTVPYGYKSEDGKLIINERTAPIVRYVFDEYAEGVPMKTIIDTLTAKGVKSPRGKKLSYTSYSAMLRNPVYIGNLMRNGQVVEDCAERMISDEVFDKVQRLLETRKRRPSTAKATERYQLYGKAFCGLCGANLVGESGTSRNGKVYNYYTCINRKRNKTCDKVAEKKEFLERHVVEKTTEYVLAEDGLPMIARMVVEENNKAFDTDELNELNKEKAQLINDIQSLVDSLLDAPQSAKKPIMERMALLEERKADLEIAIHKKKLESGIELTEEQMIAWLKLFCDGNADDEYFRERIINTFLNCVYVYPDKIVIFYNTKKSQEVYFIDFDEYQTAMCSDKSSDTMLSGGA